MNRCLESRTRTVPTSWNGEHFVSHFFTFHSSWGLKDIYLIIGAYLEFFLMRCLGSPTTSRPPSATSLPEVSRCPPPSSATPLPSRWENQPHFDYFCTRSYLLIILINRSCSRGSLSSSPPCSAARPSSTGTLARAWTRWSSQR